MVILVAYPADLLVETMTTSMEQVIGREARVDIERGMPLTENMLLPPASLVVFQSTKRGGTSGNDIWTIDPESLEVRNISLTPEEDLTPVWSPDHTRVVFTLYRSEDNVMSLWLVNRDGSGMEQFTDWWERGVGSLAAHFWSPSGDKVYFVKDHGGGPCQLLWVDSASVSRSEFPVLGAENACQPDLSADGSRLVMRDYGQGVDILVATVSSDGAEVSGVEVLVPARMAYELIELEGSPDGARGAFSADGTVFTLDVGTGDLTRISSGLAGFDQRR